MVIAAGYGYTAPAAVGGVLALIGIAVLLISVSLQRSDLRVTLITRTAMRVAPS